ncbi:MAG: DUF1579 domain-containing protein [Candidatus Zixiibacteriota bacterium]|nr:MAG: DUF1579 domain-containing protein [candidate division Zixibacteria bacterium]
METLYRIFKTAAMCLLATGTWCAAQDSTGQMPPMGPPEEMKEIAFLEGTWDVAMKAMPDPAKPDVWVDMPGTAEYTLAPGGAVMLVKYTGSFGGMEYYGYGMQTYDREKKEWQMTWADNYAGRTVMYTGQRKNGQTVMSGEEVMAGQTYPSRIRTFNETPTSFEWQMEQSLDGGKTWITFAKATYTKRQ